MRSCFEDVYLFRSQDPTFLVLRVSLHLRYQYVYTHTHTHTHTHSRPRKMYKRLSILGAMGWLRLVGSLKLQVSFAKEPYKIRDIL